MKGEAELEKAKKESVIQMGTRRVQGHGRQEKIVPRRRVKVIWCVCAGMGCGGGMLGG